ncbi:MAG: glutamine-hydrolyzing GMP synthase [Lachnospiraceae bacterium]|nr:glutamine-hydrolyzing GMP synthase [Lachnospiraceae bacterium]
MDNTETVIVLDFGGQYKQLIARRVRECGVYCEIHPYTMPVDRIREMSPKGIILTGGPNSVYEEGAPSCSRELFELGIPVLGICYGSQLMAHVLGGEVGHAGVSEYGHTGLQILLSDPEEGSIVKDVAGNSICWMSHTDRITAIPAGFETTAFTDACPVAAMEDRERKLYAVQFHPEVEHTQEGMKIFRNFLYDACGCSGSWKMSAFIETSVRELKEKIGSGQVLLGLSGGVDSSVAAALLSKAVGRQLTCVFVDHGLLRKNEADEVEAIFGKEGDFDLNFVRVNAAERFYLKLAGVTDPEMKRRIIGAEFINVFTEEAARLGQTDFLAQGTIYPDVVESGAGNGGAVIKSHHNVGGLPDHLDFKEIIEPLRMLFKDEVRALGLELGLPEKLVYRQPFPGPGLGVRIVGDVTAEKVRIVQEADAIFRQELDKAGIDTGKGQFFAALTNMRSVGVMGDGRTYDYAVTLRGVLTNDFMTATACEISWDVLQICMNRIIGEVGGVNRVLYDLTSKPPGTIELE